MSNSRKARIHVIRWHVIPQPEEGTRTVMAGDFDGPMFTGDLAAAPVVGVCGDCGHKLTEGVPTSQVGNMIIKCGECGAYNESLDSQTS